MEDIKVEIESKFWPSIGMWIVSARLPDFEYWGESCSDKDRAKAEEKVMNLAKNHIDFVREYKKSAEVRTEFIKY